MGELKVDLAQRQVFRGGQQVHLTPTEYKLLVALVRHAGKLLTHRQLLQEVWGSNFVTQTHYLRSTSCSSARQSNLTRADLASYLLSPASVIGSRQIEFQGLRTPPFLGNLYML
jgi:hypothetical protein